MPALPGLHVIAWQALGTWRCLPTHILRWLSSLLLCSDCRHGVCRDGGRHLWHGKPSRQLVMLMTLHRRVPPPCQRLLSLRHALLSPCDCRTCTPTRSPTGGSALPTSHAWIKEPGASVPAGVVPRSTSPPIPCFALSPSPSQLPSGRNSADGVCRLWPGGGHCGLDPAQASRG